jgi:hypothetical protein
MRDMNDIIIGIAGVAIFAPIIISIVGLARIGYEMYKDGDLRI